MKYRWFLSLVLLQVVVLATMVIKSALSGQEVSYNARLVETLMLTDFAIWTEARYTRHPSQADFFSAFQDGPGALEHFPAGTWIPVPDFTATMIIIPTDRKSNGEDR